MKSPRNAPCPCGSGKKYKRCCLPREREERQREAARPTGARGRFDLDDDLFGFGDAFDEEDDDPLYWNVFPYDPDEAPDPAGWLELDEDERMLAVRAAHRGVLRDLDEGGARVHVALHTTVENQAAEGDDLPVAAKLRELEEEGLSRHDAVHAVASVLSGVMWEASSGRLAGDVDLNERYFDELEKLTARSWLDEVAGEG